jgi:hypothetical protein
MGDLGQERPRTPSDWRTDRESCSGVSSTRLGRSTAHHPGVGILWPALADTHPNTERSPKESDGHMLYT